MTATGSSADDSPDAYGIAFSATGATIRNNFVTVNNSAIRSDGGGTGSIVTLNEVARPSAGHTNTFDGILLINGASSVQVVANLVRDQRGGGIELGFGAATDSYANVQVTNNTVQNNGFDSGSTPSTERLGMVGYNYTGSNVVFSRNRVHEQRRAGPGAAGRERHDREPEQLQLERRRRRGQRAGDRPGSDHARPELARHAERRDDQRRERRRHRPERPAELSGHHLARSSPTASCRSPASRGPAARSSSTWRSRPRTRAASARASPI